MHARDEAGNTALHYAAAAAQWSIVYLLLEEGDADVNARNKKEKTVYHYALDGNYYSVMDHLRNKGFGCHEEEAARRVMEARNKRESVTLSEYVDIINKDEISGLIRKEATHKRESVTLSGYVDVINKDEISGLIQYTFKMGNYRAMAILKKKLNIPSSSAQAKIAVPPAEENPLEHEAVAALLNKTATSTSDCATLLQRAAENGQQDIVELIVEKMSEKITSAAMGYALLGAVENKHHDIITLLLAEGANPNKIQLVVKGESIEVQLCNVSWQSALDIALEHEDCRTIGLLLESGANQEELIMDELNWILQQIAQGDILVSESIRTQLNQAYSAASSTPGYLSSFLKGITRPSHKKTTSTPMPAANTGDILVSESIRTQLNQAYSAASSTPGYLSSFLKGITRPSHKKTTSTPMPAANTKELAFASRPTHLLINAAKEGNMRVVEWCFDHSPEAMIQAAFHDVAVLEGHWSMVEFFLSKKSELLNHQDASGYTALIRASKEGHQAIVDLLLDKGANIHVRDINNGTALDWAWKGGHLEIVCSLIAKGAYARGSAGYEALKWAAIGGRLDNLRMLIDKGADRHRKDNIDRTLLMRAAEMGQEAIVELILSLDLSLNNNAHINAQDRYGRTALLWAAKNNQHAIAKLLLAHGADATIKDRGDKSALDWSEHYGNQLVSAVLKDEGVTGQLGPGIEIGSAPIERDESGITGQLGPGIEIGAVPIEQGAGSDQDEESIA